MNSVEKKIYNNVEKILKTHKIPYKKVKTYTDGFVAHTKYGDLNIIPDHQNRSKIVTIFTNFDKPENIDKEMLRKFNYNDFSGKCNFHYFNKDIKAMFIDFNFLCSLVS